MAFRNGLWEEETVSLCRKWYQEEVNCGREADSTIWQIWQIRERQIAQFDKFLQLHAENVYEHLSACQIGWSLQQKRLPSYQARSRDAEQSVRDRFFYFVWSYFWERALRRLVKDGTGFLFNSCVKQRAIGRNMSFDRKTQYIKCFGWFSIGTGVKKVK